MRTFREIAESIQILSDYKMDDIIKAKYEGYVDTFKYNAGASIELGKLMDDVLITKDKKFMHLSSRRSKDIEAKFQAIVKKYNLIEVGVKHV